MGKGELQGFITFLQESKRNKNQHFHLGSKKKKLWALCSEKRHHYQDPPSSFTKYQCMLHAFLPVVFKIFRLPTNNNLRGDVTASRSEHLRLNPEHSTQSIHGQDTLPPEPLYIQEVSMRTVTVVPLLIDTFIIQKPLSSSLQTVHLVPK